jgi:hypothetical protein
MSNIKIKWALSLAILLFTGAKTYSQRSLTVIINDLEASTSSATQFFSTVFSESQPKLDEIEVNILKGNTMKGVNRTDWMAPSADEILTLEAQTISKVVKRNGTAICTPVNVDCSTNLCDKVRELANGTSSILWNDLRGVNCKEVFNENRKINTITGNIFTSGNAAALARLINSEFDNKEKYLNVVIYLENKSVLSRFTLTTDRTTYSIEPEGTVNVTLKVIPDNIGQPDGINWTPEPTQTGFNSAVLRPITTTTYTAIAKHKSGCDSAPLNIEVKVNRKKTVEEDSEADVAIEFPDEAPETTSPTEEPENTKEVVSSVSKTAASTTPSIEKEETEEDIIEACNCENGPKMKDIFGKVEWLKYHPINSNEDIVDGFKFYSRQSGGRIFDLITTRICATKFKLKIYNKDGEEIWQKTYSLADAQSSSILTDSKKFSLANNFVFKMDLTQLDPEQWRGDNFFQVQIDAMDDDSNRCSPYRSPYLVFTKCPE